MPDQINVEKIEILITEMEAKLKEITGCNANIEIWFHDINNEFFDVYGLAHNALLRDGWKVREVKSWNDDTKISHISITNPSQQVHICINRRMMYARPE